MLHLELGSAGVCSYRGTCGGFRLDVVIVPDGLQFFGKTGIGALLIATALFPLGLEDCKMPRRERGCGKRGPKCGGNSPTSIPQGLNRLRKKSQVSYFFSTGSWFR